MEYIKTFEQRDRPGKAHIVRLSDNRIRVMCENKEGLSDWPIQYDNGLIAYDHPERYPLYVKSMVNRAFRYIKSL